MRGMVEQRTKKEFHMTSNANRGESKEQTVINKRNNKITAVSMHLLEYKCILEYKWPHLTNKEMQTVWLVLKN